MSRRVQPFKIILIGDAAVGKTSLRKNFMGESTGKEYLMTIGADFSVKKINVDGEDHTLQIWDIAGQKQFSSFRDQYFSGTKGILLVFALNNAESFDSLDAWISEFVKDGKNEIQPIVILGNKSDLPEREIDGATLETYMGSLQNKFTDPTFHVKYFETSAINGDNVNEAFSEITRIMVENKTHFS